MIADLAPQSTQVTEPVTPILAEPKLWKSKLGNAIKSALNGVLWFLMRISSVTLTMSEVANRSNQLPKALPNYEVSEGEAQFLFERAEVASDHTDDKIKQLLTLSSSLIAVLALFGGNVHSPTAIVIVAFPLLIAVLMCVMALGVRESALPDLSPAKRGEHSEHWASDLVIATHQNSSSHAFRVDQYRSALRYFVTALVATAILALVVGFQEPADDVNKTLKSIQDNGLMVRPSPPPPDVALPPWTYR